VAELERCCCAYGEYHTRAAALLLEVSVLVIGECAYPVYPLVDAA